MPQRKHRYINFRSFLFIAAAVIAAAIFSLVAIKSVAAAWTLLFAELVVLGILAWILGFKNAAPHKYLTFIIAIILSFIAFVNATLRINSWLLSGIDSGDYCFVSGTIEDKYTDSNETVVFLFRDYVIDGRSGGGLFYLSLNASDFVASDLLFASVGYKANFIASVYPVSLDQKIKNIGTVFRKNIRYRAYETDSSISVTPAKLKGIKKFSLSIQETLFNVLGKDNSSLAYGMITGNILGMDEEINQSFSRSGISHIFSVSGLHVMFLCILLNFILRRLKVNKYVSFGITSGIMLGYIMLASFSPSVIRACFMAIIGLFATLSGKWRDSFSSLLFSITVILVVMPLYFLEVGFILSCSAVMGIIFFASPATNALKRIPMPKKVAKNNTLRVLHNKAMQGIALSFSVQIAILPAVMFFFAEIQTYSLVVNILLMPVLSFGFIFLQAALILALIWSEFSVFLRLAFYPFYLVILTSNIFAELPYAKVYAHTNSSIFIVYLLYFLISRFYMTQTKYGGFIKRLSCSACAFTLMLYSIISALPLKNYDGIVAPIHGIRDVTSIVRVQNKTIIIGDFNVLYDIRNSMNEFSIYNIDMVFLTSCNSQTAKRLKYFFRFKRMPLIFCYMETGADYTADFLNEDISTFYLFDMFTVLPLNLKPFISNSGVFLGYKLTQSDITTAFMSYKSIYQEIDKYLFNDTAILRCYNVSEYLDGRIYLSNFKDKKDTYGNSIFSCEDEGAEYFDLKDGIFYSK